MISTPRDSAIDGIALALEAYGAVLSTVPVKRGFPASNSGDDDFILPSISVSVQTEPLGDQRRSVYRETDNGDGTVTILYEQDRRALGGTIELWTKTKTEREPIELEIDRLFAGSIVADFSTDGPSPPGLILDLSLLYDARVRVRIIDKNEQDASGGRDGYFRLIYSFEVVVPYLISVDYNQATFTAIAEVGEGVEPD